jgi:hypothetical protein
VNSLPDLRAGIYRHYKGPLYLVLGYGHDANQEDRTVVVYVGLQLDGAKSGARLSVRTADDFFAIVDRNTGATVNDDWDGTDPPPVQRFTYLGPTVIGPPIGGPP